MILELVVAKFSIILGVVFYYWMRNRQVDKRRDENAA